MKDRIYIIESRDASGSLVLQGPQPESVFGDKAISGITDWEMSRVIFAKLPGAVLTGDTIPNWPTLLNPNWKARAKTW